MLHVIRIRYKTTTDGYHSVYEDKFKANNHMKRWQEAYPDMEYYLESTEDYEVLFVPSISNKRKEMQVRFPESIGSMFVIGGV